MPDATEEVASDDTQENDASYETTTTDYSYNDPITTTQPASIPGWYIYK